MTEALAKSFLQRLSSVILQENEAPTTPEDQTQKLKNRIEEIGSFLGEADRSKQEDGLVCNLESDSIETLIHDAYNYVDQFVVSENISQDGSNQEAQFCSELEKIDERLARISLPKEEIGQSSSSGDGVDVVGEESPAPFALNYRTLPSYLRSCLLFCSHLSEKILIRRGRLVRLLVAQGILQEREGVVMEDIAEENINQLVGQGMLRVEIKYKSELIEVVDPYLKICRHMLKQGKGMVKSLPDSDYNFSEISSTVFIHYCSETITTSFNDLPVRSLFVIGDISKGLASSDHWEEGIPDDHWTCVRNAIHNFNFLRVLELENLCIKSLPEEIGDLIQLRYLGLKHSALDEIPESIGNLLNLQTLDIRYPRSLRVLPNAILNLLQLRHLKLSGMFKIKVPSGMGVLRNLQSLTGLHLRYDIIKELRSLTQLRKLELIDVSEEHGDELSASIMKMLRLEYLCLATKDIIAYIIDDYENDELLPTLEQFSPPPSIRKLRLYGRLMDLPQWVCTMENLTKLILGGSFLSEEAFSILQFLPNLKYLKLLRAHEVKVINKDFFKVGGFPKLEALIIYSKNLVEWTEIKEGALPSLAFLCFRCCNQLMNLPEGLQYVKTLKVLQIWPMHPDLKRRLKSDGGKENYKIKHIPKKHFFSSFLNAWVAI